MLCKIKGKKIKRNEIKNAVAPPENPTLNELKIPIILYSIVRVVFILKFQATQKQTKKNLLQDIIIHYLTNSLLINLN